MPNIIGEFVAARTQQVAGTFLDALMRLPEDRRSWRPLDRGRTASNQFAEVALANLYTAQLLQTHKWSRDRFESFERDKAELETDWTNMRRTFDENLTVLLDAIRAVRDEDLSVQIELPWGPQSLSEIVSYPWWNMSYHEGQVNYIYFLAGGE